jgi:hypothetical protein
MFDALIDEHIIAIRMIFISVLKDMMYYAAASTAF